MGQQEGIHEQGHFNGKDCTYAAVTDDAVGTSSKIPWKPALNFLIKPMAIVAVVFAPLFI